MAWARPFSTVKLPDCQQNFDSLSALLKIVPNGPAPSLPSSPADGQISAVTVSGNYTWLFMFSKATSRWHFIGGPPLLNQVDTSEGTSSTTYTDLATVGPSVTVPFAGDYIVEGGANAGWNINQNELAIAAVKRGAAATSDADFVVEFTAVSGSFFGGIMQGSRRMLFTGLTATEVLKLQYRQGTAVATNWSNRWLSITPVSVTG